MPGAAAGQTPPSPKPLKIGRDTDFQTKSTKDINYDRPNSKTTKCVDARRCQCLWNTKAPLWVVPHTQIQIPYGGRGPS